MKKYIFFTFFIIQISLSGAVNSKQLKDKDIKLDEQPNAVLPRLIGRLKKIYPKDAKAKGIEAKVFTSIKINKKGLVDEVKVTKVVLLQKTAENESLVLKKAFSGAVKKALLAARFTPPIVDGKNVAVRMSIPIFFQLR